MVFQTRLTIRWSPGQLTQDVNLMLCFEPPNANKLSHKQNLVAWKVVTMKAKPGKAKNQAVITYKQHLGFGCNTLEQGNIVGAQSVIECDPGQTARLVEEDSIPLWEDPTDEKSNGRLLKAKNETSTRRMMSIGTLDPEYSPTFLWTVGSGNIIEAEFHPKLMGFVNLGYQESQFITADITSAKMWEVDLGALPSSSTWDFIEGGQGDFKIEPVGM